MLHKLLLVFSLAIIVSAMGCDEADEPLTDANGEQDFISAELDREFRLEIGETALVESEGIKIELLDIPEDSRCPSDVTCIWEGRVKVVVNILKDEVDLGDFILTGNGGDDEATAVFDGYSVKLLNVSPYPVSTETIELSDYIIILEVSIVLNG